MSDVIGRPKTIKLTDDIEWIAAVKKAVSYNPETGLFYWLHRTADLCNGSQSEANRFNAKHSGKQALTAKSHGYRRASVLGRVVNAHQVAFAISHGFIPEVIDHINGEKSDNRLSNLRAATVALNNKNAPRRRDNTSGVTGVGFDLRNNRWVAYINRAGKFSRVGRFATFEAAVEARKLAEKKEGYHANHGR